MSDLNFLVIEYVPHLMDGTKLTPARIDGHYGSHELAAEVAELWAANPLHAETRIVVAEIRTEIKAPAHWQRRKTENGDRA